MHVHACHMLLQEALEAYKEQNKFLSSEMVELHAIRSDEKETMRAHSRSVMSHACTCMYILHTCYMFAI